MSAAAVFVSGLAGFAAPGAFAATGDAIRGSIWQDYESNGVFDTYESGIAGIEVFAYDDAGNVSGPAITAADGTYSLPVTSDATRWRVEANVPETSAWSEWEDTVVARTADGNTNGTTVQFVDVVDGAGAAGVDFSFQVPEYFVEENPLVYVPAFRYGPIDGAEADEFGSAVFPYDSESADGTTPVAMSGHIPWSQIGATYGTAWQRASSADEVGTLYVAAYYRRHAAFGPGGIGAVYRATPDGADWSAPTASAEVAIDLTEWGIDLGGPSDDDAVAGDPNGLRPSSTADNPAYDWTRDAQAWTRVGRAGIGGLALSPDGSKLFAVNLYTRDLVQIELNDAGDPVSASEISLDAYFPDDSDVRPFGISTSPETNQIILTATNTAESTQDSADLRSYVFTFDPASPGALTRVLDFGLDFDRGFWNTNANSSLDYRPWTLDTEVWERENAAFFPQPLLEKATYLHGDLILGVRNLSGDQLGAGGTFVTGDPSSDKTVEHVILPGNVLKATPADDGSWQLENNGVAGGVSGAGEPGADLGPGGTGFFDTTWQSTKSEALGSIVTVPSRADGILTTGIHVGQGFWHSGVRRLYQDTGEHHGPRGAIVIQRGQPSSDEPEITSKGNGLGSATALASAAPIEIGNYVWYDVDGDGIQDPEEAPVVGATVNLYEVAEDGTRTRVSSTTTDARGEYYFSSDPSLNDDGYALRTLTDYVVGIDEPADYAEGGPLDGWYPTVPDTGDGESYAADRNDSDGIVEESEAGDFPYAAVTTGGPGQNDHTIDFGYLQLDYELTKRTVSGPVENADDDGTWVVTYELIVENPSVGTGGYDLTDDLTGYGDGIDVVGTRVLSGPEGAALNEAWDGVDDQRVITERLPIAPGSTEENGSAHVYTLEVTVRLSTDADTGEATVDPGQLGCTDGQQPGDATTGLFNVAVLDPIGHEDLVDDECGELPLVTLDKTIVAEPAPVDGEQGVWEVVYGLLVRSETGAATDYDLTDHLRFGTGIDIRSVSAESVDPEGIAVNPGFDGVDDQTIVTDHPIDGGTQHSYEVTVRYTVDLPYPPTQPDASDCSLADGSEEGTGLLNQARTSFNGYPSDDDECREVGEPTHEKELLSAEPIGDGQWRADYRITVENKGVESTRYDLDDVLRYAEDVTVVSSEVTGSPDGVTLADPAWDGLERTRIATDVALAGTDDEGYAPHEYLVSVVADVPLQLPGAGGDDDPTACATEAGTPGSRALSNTTTLTDPADATEEDEACAELPSIEIDKSVSGGPTPNGDGTWTVTYDVVATNSGAAAGVYDVTDRMSPEGDLDVVSGAVVSAPEGVTPRDSWTGLGDEGADENVIASGVELPSGGVHTYQVEVVVALDAALGELVVASCDTLGAGAPGGLVNTAGIRHNDLEDDDEECVAVPSITVEKTISEGPTPNGDGTYTIVYDLLARNSGEAAGDYDLSDRLRYGAGIEIVASEIATAPDGVSTSDSWTGLGEDGADENVIATGVSLAAGKSHTYRVSATVELDEATIDPATLACPEPGSGEAGGLANSTELVHNGIVSDDDVCASLPLIDVAKSIADGPVGGGDGTWTIAYELVVTNDGDAAGDYDLDDRLRYGEGTVVESASVTSVPDGVSIQGGWTGLGEAGAAENVIADGVTIDAGAAHVYRVEVVVSLDAEAVSGESLACAEPGSGASGGLANTAAVTHNGEDRDAEACAELPLIEVEKSISGMPAPVAGEPGSYDVDYDLVVTNRGPGAGSYDLDDRLAPGEGIRVIGIQDVETDADDPVGIEEGFDGLDAPRIVSGQPIAGGAVHTYTVTVRYAADAGAVDAAGATCDADGAPGAPGTLGNLAVVGWNGIEDRDDVCLTPAQPLLDKTLVSAEPVGDGLWEVAYDLTVGSASDAGTTYDLDDELLFAPSIRTQDVTVTGPEGVAVSDTFDGEADLRIATDVALPGLADDGYAPHVYRVTVVAEVPLTFEDAADDGTGSPSCTVPGGANLLEQGLNNAATLTDESGSTQVDTDCAPVPAFAIDKTVVDTSATGEDVVTTYRIAVRNTGGVAGSYVLYDQLLYGDAAEVTGVEVSNETPGDVPVLSTFTGLGAEADAADNAITAETALAAGAEDVFRVTVSATVPIGVGEAVASCSEDGGVALGGLLNLAQIEHNDLVAADTACVDGPTRNPLNATGSQLMAAGLVSALLLLAAGAGVILLARRRGVRTVTGEDEG